MSAALTMERSRDDEPAVLPIALALAVGAHVAVAWFAPADHDLPEPPPAPLEVQLNASPPAPPKPQPVPEPERVTSQTALVRHVAAAPVRAAAGKLLAAVVPAANAGADAPVDFVTDPNGTSYGFGVVSRGGTSQEEGSRGPTARAAPPTSAPALASAEDLSERPRLVVDDPCRGFFPDEATADAAAAVVRVVIEPSGKVRSVILLEETPSGQGFGAAARSCIRAQRFSIPRDREGRAVATATAIRVRFER